MEPLGAFLDEEWELLSRMFSTEEQDSIFGTSPNFWPILDEANFSIGPIDESLSQLVPNCETLHYFSQESSNSSPTNSVFFPTNLSPENLYFSNSNLFQETNSTLESIAFNNAMDNAENNFSLPIFPDNTIEEILCKEEEKRCENSGNADDQPSIELQVKRKNDLSDAPKKKSRVSRDAQKGKKNATFKKNEKLNTLINGNGAEETNNGGRNGQSSSCCSSEDDSNASQDPNGGETSDSKTISALNSNGKIRAGRGAATDPQSLYARKRRERINERLRILQSLVPNGTKVDISTMLEEAVQYVKFLQLQIKLLSSDELWMYAPIAYNGMDMGLYQKISPTL